MPEQDPAGRFQERSSLWFLVHQVSKSDGWASSSQPFSEREWLLIRLEVPCVTPGDGRTRTHVAELFPMEGL